MEIFEKIEYDINNHINESLGMFDKQYEIADKLSINIYDMIVNKEKHKVFSVDSDNINFVDVLIDKNILKTNAEIYGFNDETKTVKLTVNLNEMDLKDKNSFIRLMKNILTHELMHGNIFLHRYLNGEDINDIPDYYDICQKIFNNKIKTSAVYQEFAYALYSIYYQEMQSIVSQTYVQIENYYKQHNIKPNRENFKYVLKKIESYSTYYGNINRTVPLIKFMLSYDEKHFLEGLEEVGFNFDKKTLEKYLNLIIKRSEEAIKNIDRNAMLFYYEHIK